MANRSVVVDLLVRTNQFTAGMRRASHDMSSETTNMETKVRALQMQIGLLGVGMVAFAAVAVAKWAEFDKAMSRVEATGGEAAARIEELNEAAKSDEVIALGYNAVEASDAIYELAKAGVSASYIMGGAMAGAMSLAAAETMDAAESASIMASALNQFGLDGSDAAHVADLITAAAGKAQGSAHDLGFALKQSGLVANQFGLTIEETAGTLALFASAGLIGSDAGTSLRTMLLHLAGPSTKAAKLMKEIGLEIYGADGEMVTMEQLANNLQTSMGTLGEAQRNQALATIFGADATRAASLLYREGGDAVVEWMGKVNDAGYAQEVARKRMDNLSGDIKKLSATWDRAMIEMGSSADAPLRKLVQGISSLVDWFGDLDPAIQGVIMAITGGGGLVILATLGIAQIIKALGMLRAGLIATGVVGEASAARLTRAFGKGAGFAGIIALATFALVKLVDGLANLADGGGRAVKSVEEATAAILDLKNASAGVDDLFDFKRMTLTGKATDSVESITEAMDALTGNGATRKLDLWASKLDEFFNTSFISSVSDSAKQFEALDEALSGTFAKSPELAAIGFDNLYASVDHTKYSTEDLMELLPGYAAAIQNASNEADIAAGAINGQAGSLDAMGESTAAVTAEEVAAKKAHDEYVESIVDSFTSFFDLGDTYQGVIDGQREIAESAAEESESTEDSWQNFYDGTTVTFDNYIAKLSEQVAAQETWAANMISLTGRMKTEMPADMQVAAQEMINELRGLGPEGAAQVAMLNTLSAPQLQQVVDLFNRQGVAAGEEWATGVEAAENPEVDVESDEADKRLAAVAESMRKLDAAHANPKVTVDTTQTMARLSAVQSAMDSIRKRGIAVALNAPILGPPAPGFPGNATGGAIAGPGTGTSDSIPARLSNGEHVLTASDVQKAGGQDAVYRMRNAIQSGMLKFAGGGAVQVNGRSLDYWKGALLDQGEALRLQIQIRDLKADLAKTGEDAVTGLDRDRVSYDLEEALRKWSEGQFANGLNAQQSIDSRIDQIEATQERMDLRSEYGQNIKRRELTDDLTSGKSGAINTLDRIRSDVLPNLTWEQAPLTDALNAAEKAAGTLYARLELVTGQIEKATEKAKDLQSISDSVKNGLVGGFSLDKITQTATVNPFTGQVSGGAGSAGKGMLASAQGYAKKVKEFSQKLKALADKGYSGVILQEIAAMGVEAGIPAADALLSLSATDTKALNQAYQSIGAFGKKAGQAVTEGFYQGGLAAADGVVKGLEASKGKINKAIMDMAMTMQDALKRALGIASPSRKFRDMMHFVGQGVAVGLDDQRGVVADASARLFGGVTVPGGGGFYGPGGSGAGSPGDVTARLSDEQVERLAVAFETGNVRNINMATAQKNRKMELTYGARGR